LLGKQNRIRWSVSQKGMTIFHGVPLLRLEDGFWRKRHWWSYAPSIPAARCPACKLEMFAYNNEAQENLRNEWRASIIINRFLLPVAAAVGAMAVRDWTSHSPVPLLWQLVMGGFTLVALVLCVLSAVHALRYCRSGSTS
jgi:hypothetical protein